MTPDEIYQDFEAGFAGRKFSAGLLIAFIDFYIKLGVPDLGASNLGDVLKFFPRQQTTAAGTRANTLIVKLADGKTLSLRPFYNNIERFFRADQKRFDYPSCAPHATQAWVDYVPWLDALAPLGRDELLSLRERVVNYVLATLQSQEFDPASITVEPPMFRLLLESFDMKAGKDEPSGAAFQGLVFGFLRADNPHLQIEIAKVRTGSKRLQRVADIDGWEGDRLAISAEIKQLKLKLEHIPDLEGFANEIGRRAALGMVVALEFEDGVRGTLEGMGLKALTTADLLKIVELWDPLKQRTAVASFVYYARRVEKNSSLASRIERFVKEMSTQATPETPLATS
jgi:hypothetical protein